MVATVGAMATMSTADSELIELGTRPQLRPYIAELWARREFMVFVPYNDIRVQNIDTMFGQFWHILNPIMQVSVYWLVFGVIAKLDRGTDNFIGFLLIGVFLFSLSSRVVTDSVRTIERYQGLIRTIDYPRALMPISTVIEHTMAFIPSAVVLMVAMPITGEQPTWRWLFFPVVLILQFSLNSGLALLAARAGHRVRDLSQVTQHFMRLMFYASGVLFDVSRFVDSDRLLKLFALNPFYDIIHTARWALMNDGLRMEAWIGLVAWAVVLPSIGFPVFLRAEHRYGAA